MKKGTLIIDLQFGSTGKGLLAGYLAERDKPDTLVTAWGPNAGHTYIASTGRKYVHTMLANGVVSPNLRRVMIGPGSVINADSLFEELQSVAHLGVGLDQLFIHEHAAVVTREHRGTEAGTMLAIGSTAKGTGQAAIQRIKRDPKDLNVAKALLPEPLRSRVVNTERWLELLDQAEVLQIEGAQGYSLSMYHGFYPYTTSRDVSTAQVLADCGIPYAMAREIEVVGTCRTYPIRVANRFILDKQVGWSGPHYDDQEETNFESIKQPVELTTVTKLPRRIFTFSETQIRQAIRVTGAQSVFLNFANYCDVATLNAIMQTIEKYAPIAYIGYGPHKQDVEETSYTKRKA